MPTAFVATWGSGKPVVGFLAEFDALPNLSQKSGELTKTDIIPGGPGQVVATTFSGPPVAQQPSQPRWRWKNTGSREPSRSLALLLKRR